MASCFVALLAVASWSAFVTCKPTGDDVTNVELRMPDVQPQVPDVYLCHAAKMGEISKYITGFIPHGDMHTAHHILVFGCSEPGSSTDTWNCGEMHGKDHSMPTSSPCGSDTKIIYAWAMDAPELKLPEGVGFHVGGDSDIQWLVVQIHYTDVTKFLPPKNEKDTSGVTLLTTTKPTPKQAGVYLLATGGELPPQSTTYLETACPLHENVVMHPFAYRVHAHTHGQVTSGYRVRDGQWTELGRQSPQKPQMFYPITIASDVTVTEGDYLAARCTMMNNENRTIEIGQTQNDEMCNFYVMFWVEGDQLPEENYCVSDGEGWSSEQSLHVENLPDDVSVIPGTNKLLEETHKMMSDMEESEKQMEDDLESILGNWQEDEDDATDEDEMDDVAQYQMGNSQDDLFDEPYNRMGIF